MKAMVIVDIPENKKINDLFAPFNTKVTLDYGNEVIYLEGIKLLIKTYKKL